MVEKGTERDLSKSIGLVDSLSGTFYLSLNSYGDYEALLDNVSDNEPQLGFYSDMSLPDTIDFIRSVKFELTTKSR